MKKKKSHKKKHLHFYDSRYLSVISHEIILNLAL